MTDVPFPVQYSQPMRHTGLRTLALLASSNPQVASLLFSDDPEQAASVHPHYTCHLDDTERVALLDICSQVHTVDEFVARIAEMVDGMQQAGSS
ncbi:MAG: hypothetical protein GFH27_549279n393 [Chloroflexi bacterium AL-W]|nr:hypothetical protein [Chloroflexi bacterium AL-N1]NOK65359.1 hypothetical protein [Chloroflexi bacterium AL-N10]NOK72375.1 hypothetical protein [Chloroflexi bacterium AL-N5]NOK79538.1 hypothetical protein [Chloroflexi bacterium AL-W]NOK87454.1 hypothetical protein [Chloroflexi bacterium AL-N15]